MRYWIVILLSSIFLCFDVRWVQSDIDEDKWISFLKGLASEINFSGNVFVSKMDQNGTGMLFGISDKPMSKITQIPVKQLVHIIVDEESKIDAFYNQHLSRFEKAEFAIQEFDALKIPAFRAHAVYYILEGDKEFVLKKSTDLVELKLAGALFTLRDERLSLDADISSLFEAFLDFSERKGLLKLSNKIKLPKLKEKYPTLPRRINISTIFPDANQLPWGAEEWIVHPNSDDIGYFSQLYGERVVYEGISEKTHSSKPVVEVIFYVFERIKMPNTMLQIVRSRLPQEDVFSHIENDYGQTSLSIEHDKMDLNRLLIVRGIFLCEIRVYWKASLPDEREALLKVYAEYMDNALKRYWPVGSEDREQRTEDRRKNSFLAS